MQVMRVRKISQRAKIIEEEIVLHPRTTFPDHLSPTERSLRGSPLFHQTIQWASRSPVFFLFIQPDTRFLEQSTEVKEIYLLTNSGNKCITKIARRRNRHQKALHYTLLKNSSLHVLRIIFRHAQWAKSKQQKINWKVIFLFKNFRSKKWEKQKDIGQILLENDASILSPNHCSDVVEERKICETQWAMGKVEFVSRNFKKFIFCDENYRKKLVKIVMTNWPTKKSSIGYWKNFSISKFTVKAGLNNIPFAS